MRDRACLVSYYWMEGFRELNREDSPFWKTVCQLALLIGHHHQADGLHQELQHYILPSSPDRLERDMT